MPIITVTHTLRTFYEVPEGFSINEIRSRLDEHSGLQDAEDDLRTAHHLALTETYGFKKVSEVGQGVGFSITEGYDTP